MLVFLGGLYKIDSSYTLAIFAGLIVRWRCFQAKGSDYFFDDAPYWNVSGLLLTFLYYPKVQKILSATWPQPKANTFSI